jgi:hypothetical protein
MESIDNPNVEPLAEEICENESKAAPTADETPAAMVATTANGKKTPRRSRTSIEILTQGITHFD